MLVMSRRKNESVVISDDIIVTVIEIREDKVRLGFEVPREMTLHRKEVYDMLDDSQTSRHPSSELQKRIESQKQIIRMLEQRIEDQSELIRSQDERIQQLGLNSTEG